MEKEFVDDQTLVAAYSALLQDFISASEEDIKKIFENPTFSARDETKVYYLQLWGQCKITASQLIQVDSSHLLAFPNGRRQLLKQINHYAQSKITEPSNLLIALDAIFELSNGMSGLSDRVCPCQDFGNGSSAMFINASSKSEFSRNALNHYLNIGDQMTADPNFATSDTGKVESFLLRRGEALDLDKSMPKVEFDTTSKLVDCMEEELVDDQSLVAAYSALLQDFNSSSEEDIKNIFENPCYSARDETKRNYLKCWSQCKIAATELIQIDSSHFLAFELGRDALKTQIDHYAQSKIAEPSNLSKALFAIFRLSSAMSGLLNQFCPCQDFGNGSSVMFVNASSASEFSRNALNHYLNIGDQMTADPNFATSDTGKVESFLLRRGEALDLDKSMPAVDFDTTFVALVAPSMEGKTQSAFSFKKIRSLYFPLTGTDNFNGAHQDIYMNYSSHADFLSQCAKKDSYKLPLNVDVSKLQANKQTKYWTLGFLKKIVETSPLTLTQPWMMFYANLGRLVVEPCSIDELETACSGSGKRFFDGYCLFLDEFFESYWNVFLRNLARAFGLACVVSNTNSKIANPVGSHSSSGGSETLAVWCLVFSKLNYASASILNTTYGLESSVQSIYYHPATPDSVKRFLIDFAGIDIVLTPDERHKRPAEAVKTQIAALRPGVAAFVAEALAAFAAKLKVLKGTGPITLGWFLDFICDFVSSKLLMRKRRLEVSELSFLAQVGMIFPQAYVSVTAEQIESAKLLTTDKEKDKESRQLCNQNSYINDHLFYISNPIDSSSSYFLTFEPARSSVDPSQKMPLQVFNSDYELIDWQHELTHFKGSELMTILSCSFLSIGKNSNMTVAKLVAKYAKMRDVEADANETAQFDSDKFLDVLGAAVMFEASRYDHQTRARTFAGQPGTSFVSNLLFHLIDQDIDDAGSSLSVSYPAELSQFLNKCRIPHLLTVNHDLQALSSLNFGTDSSYFVRSLTRCKNISEIDARCDLKFDSVFQGIVSLECRNYFDQISNSTLLSCLRKGVAAGARLMIVVCTAFRWDLADANINEFSKFCLNSGVNLYRAERNADETFTFVDYSSSLASFDDPDRVCVVLEIDRIHGKNKNN